MTRRLKEYGVEQEIRIRDPWSTPRVKVFVIIRQYDYNGAVEHEIWLEDCVADVVIKKIRAALDILPTSK